MLFLHHVPCGAAPSGAALREANRYAPGRGAKERKSMKKRLVMMAMGALLALGAFGLMGCSGGGNAGSGEADSAAGTVPTGEVSVYSREDGSGTRGAFVELMGIEEKDASGEKVDMTTTSAAITNSTSVMMTSDRKSVV